MLKSITLVFSGALIVILSGCGPLATINYHQVGACNGYATGGGAVSVGPHAAYVVFKIEGIDNRQPGIDFNFDPSRLFVNQATKEFVDPNLQFAQDLGVFGTVPVTIPHGQQIGINGFSIVVVSTSNANGSAEANQTPYSLLYDTQASDPGIVMNKTNSSQITWTQTEDCHTMILQ